MTRRRILTGYAVCLLVLAAGAQAHVPPPQDGRTEAIVLLSSPPLARAGGPRAAASERIVAEHRRFVRVLRAALPDASVRWSYSTVLNGVAVELPRSETLRLRTLPGVRDVVVSVGYARAADATVTAARTSWATGLPNQGAGIKIGIIDDGVDQSHPYFDPSTYTMPAGFPKGQRAFTTAKVIVARAFPPPGVAWKNAGKPFDPGQSEHATHVAGIAAGNADTRASGGRTVSGVAPRAYIGNYKALTAPTDAGVGLDGNAAEIVAAIEAAVTDGMDVINLSIGEPEVQPSRDLVALALDAAAAAGVVPVVAAGNDFDDFGPGSLSSPGTSAEAITVAAVSRGGSENDVLASFSSAGPTPLSLRLKPDVSAPGVAVLSSVPGGWRVLSGTSMATPQVSGVAALLLERHPDWTPRQVKAALVETADPAYTAVGVPAPPTRGGGGVVDALRADVPLLTAAPASVSLGLVRPDGLPATATVALEDAGGGAGDWSVAVDARQAPAGAGLTVPSTVTVPGTLTLSSVVPPTSAEGDVTGFVTLTRDTDVRRIPFWYRVTRPALASASRELRATGTFAGNTRGRRALVQTYRYPDVPVGSSLDAVLSGPEQVFRVVLHAPAANFGVVVTRRARGVRVEPRVVASGDENRLTGYAALPLNLNPYLAQFGNPVLAAGAVRPSAGAYDVVFDSPTASGAGAFSFRFWVNDMTPPSARLVTSAVRHGADIRVAVSDAGSGVDPTTLVVRVDGDERTATLRAGVVRVPTTGLRPGRHRLRLQISDYQESRNMENVPPILPNTRVVATSFAVR